MAVRSRARAPLVLLAVLALLAGLWAGLIRLGWTLPPLQPHLAGAHGPLMVAGFLGTVIGLERAVALGRRPAYAAPALTGAGGLALLIGLPSPLGPALVALGSLGLVVVNLALVRRQPSLFTFALTLGALAWLAGNLLWLVGWPVYRLALLWAGFLILTIAGERLELSRIGRPPPLAHSLFLVALGLFLAGLAAAALAPSWGPRLAGLGALALALWLARYDIARRTVRQPGATRYIALALLAGYLWLAFGGGLLLLRGLPPAGPLYDASLHALFLGFVFSMVFGHALLIFPGVMGLTLAFGRRLYLPLGLLHASLALRLLADLASGGTSPLRLWAGALNALAVVAFFPLMLSLRGKEG